jgi:hypothetical protein
MSMIQSDLLLGQEGGGGYTIERSLRFSSSDSAFLSRTPASSGNRKTWTWAGWVKRCTGNASNHDRWFAVSGTATDTCFFIGFGDTDDKLYVQFGYVPNYKLITSAVFRDPSAWYHVVLSVDVTQSTASSKVKVYINGIEQTNFSTDQRSSISNQDWGINKSGLEHTIGRSFSSYLNGYLADIHFIDGQALDPTSFGEYDTNGVWQPKAFSGGSFGTNGFRLPFSDNSTAAALGTDTSGNSNSWTPNNFSVAAGAGNDSLVDTPTNGSQVDTGVGGEVVGNYCTLNPLFSGTTLTNGNLDAEGPSNNWFIGRGTIAFPIADKWYWEATVTGTAAASYSINVATAAAANSTGDVTTATGIYGIVNNTSTTTTKFINGTASTISTAAAWAQNDILMCAYDGATGKVWFGRNGTWYPPTNGGSAGNPGAGTNETMTASGTVFPAVHCYGTSGDMTVNFGQRPFAYTAPSGFKALCTTNLPEPTIADGSTAMDVKLYTGNGSTQTISGLNFSPDFGWFKRRGPSAASHFLFDQVRGAGKFLVSNTTAAEGNDSVYTLQSFNSDGYTMGSTGAMNESGSTYVVWSWDAGSSTVTNTAGSISSQVRANASAGFSVVTFTSSSSVSTVGHGLGVAPYLIITKNRSVSNTWWTYHNAIGNTKAMRLDTTDAQTTISSTWNNTSPTSTVFTVGGEWGNGNNIVAYCFAPVAGYSSFGSYTGNGSTDGPFVYTGFRPRWILYKRTDTTGYWLLVDALRNGFNPDNNTLCPNLSDAEDPTDVLDILSNGFKLRVTGSSSNASGGTYIYYAVAENPFQYARAR